MQKVNEKSCIGGGAKSIGYGDGIDTGWGDGISKDNYPFDGGYTGP